MKISVIACDKSGYPAFIKFQAAYPSNHEFIDIIQVPCLGNIKESDILEILEGDCDRVLFVGCPLDSCFHREGSRFAQRRIIRINHLLEEADIPKQVLISYVTIDKISELKRILDQIPETSFPEEFSS